MTTWPKQRECDAFYGNPRGKNGAASPAWESANLVSVRPKFKITYAGKPVLSVRIHKKCAASLTRVFDQIWEAAGQDQGVIDDWGASIFGGSYNFRLMRGINTLSMHSYACAIDLDPGRNGQYDRTPHFTANSPVVKAFKAEGWLWGGDWNGNGLSSDEPRCDGMHFQAARL